MRKYYLKRIFICFTAFLYADLILSLKNGREILTTNLLMTSLFFIVAVILTIFWSKERLKKNHQADKIKRDERYRAMRDRFTYQFVCALAFLVPLGLIVAGYFQIEVISIKTISAILILLAVIYFVCLDYKKFRDRI
ncbi:hypothetical protein [Listeria costaricensis]|uniref:hypothetical protein n=1 Tax=Listeria costaricensis TaxID=2026604 RepID=UPI000C084CBA|nr:hypothetical protein [Listeria costaricensis]